MASLQISGTLSARKDRLNKMDSGAAKDFEVFLKNMDGMFSGVRDTVFLSLDIAAMTSSGVITISGIVSKGKLKSSRRGKIGSSSFEKILQNTVLK
jgi:hypothetical protein